MYRRAGAYEYALGACREVPAFAGMTEGGVMWMRPLGACREVPAFAGMTEGGVMWVGLSATGLC